MGVLLGMVALPGVFADSAAALAADDGSPGDSHQAAAGVVEPVAVGMGPDVTSRGWPEQVRGEVLRAVAVLGIDEAAGDAAQPPAIVDPPLLGVGTELGGVLRVEQDGFSGFEW